MSEGGTNDAAVEIILAYNIQEYFRAPAPGGSTTSLEARARRSWDASRLPVLLLARR
jgi:hypothetical protein